MPCQSFQSMVSYLPDAGIKKPSGKPGTPVSQGKEIRAGEVYVRTVSFRLPDKRRGTLSGGTGHGRFRRTAEAPCDGTDGRVPFVLPPRCPASAMQPAEVVGNGRWDGTARAPRCKCKTVKALSPTLGIAGESPQHSEDLQRKARPEGERSDNHLETRIDRNNLFLKSYQNYASFP